MNQALASQMQLQRTVNRLLPDTLRSCDAQTARADASAWLEDFHRGSRQVLEQCYVDHFDTAAQAIGSILDGADRETVIHELFYRLISDADLRAKFRGGSLRAWIAVAARNMAIDYARRRRREQPADLAPHATKDVHPKTTMEASIEARQVVERFRATHLPEKYRRVFEARFIQQLDQSEAARLLGMHRTTLLYQELRIRKLLKSFLVRSELP
jgi:RNA polymerase sigma-70 factor (ECF subfamily)